MVDFSNIYLSPEEKVIFKKFKKSGSAILTKKEFILFRKSGLIQNSLGGTSDYLDGLADSGECRLNLTGKRYQSFLAERRHREIMNSFIWPIIVAAITTILIHVLKLLWSSLL